MECLFLAQCICLGYDVLALGNCPSHDPPRSIVFRTALIIDERTVDYFRENGIPQGKPVLVLAKRLVSKKRPFTIPGYEFMLVDCKYNAKKNAGPDGCMLFRLSLDKNAKDEMLKCLKCKGDDTYITFFCKWEKDPDHENTYFAKRVSKDHLGRVRFSK